MHTRTHTYIRTHVRTHTTHRHRRRPGVDRRREGKVGTSRHARCGKRRRGGPTPTSDSGGWRTFEWLTSRQGPGLRRHRDDPGCSESVDVNEESRRHSPPPGSRHDKRVEDGLHITGHDLREDRVPTDRTRSQLSSVGPWTLTMNHGHPPCVGDRTRGTGP